MPRLQKIAGLPDCLFCPIGHPVAADHSGRFVPGGIRRARSFLFERKTRQFGNSALNFKKYWFCLLIYIQTV